MSQRRFSSRSKKTKYLLIEYLLFKSSKCLPVSLKCPWMQRCSPWTPLCDWNLDPRVQSSCVFSCFLLLIIPARAGRTPRSELWGDGPHFHFASAPPSLILWQHFRQFPLLCSSYKPLKETVAFFKKNKTILSNSSKKIQHFSFYFNVFSHRVLFAELSPYWCLPAKITDKLTLQGSWFAEIADPTKNFFCCCSEYDQIILRPWRRMSEMPLATRFFFSKLKLENTATLDWSGLLSALHLVFYAMHLWHQAISRAANTDAKRRSISGCWWTFFSEHNYTAARQIYSLLLAVQPANECLWSFPATATISQSDRRFSSGAPHQMDCAAM